MCKVQLIPKLHRKKTVEEYFKQNNLVWCLKGPDYKQRQLFCNYSYYYNNKKAKWHKKSSQYDGNHIANYKG